MTETTSFPTTKHIGTIGKIGRRGPACIVLPTVDKNGHPGKRWVTYRDIERLGLLDVPVGEAVVRVERLEFNL